MSSLVAARDALRELEGHPFTAIGRAATLVWLTFGDEVPWVNFRGEHTTLPELALHVQCRWRLVRGAAVVVEKGDLYVPGASSGADFAAGGEIGTSRFDDRVEAVSWIVAAQAPAVEEVYVGDEFDLRLTLSSGLTLEVFPAGRSEWEDWRFLSSADGRPHYVVENGSVSVA
ncbi:hypothetical protein OG539_02265 [Actinacidiphila glaucinigra]|uniref:hypothetical protein n=1 Tax=Actinacidiphila glaucinigra TaxID=235986 RepID=UPI002DD9E0BF|nr:hypothetical protein [Actinacidiphila glaucinigra]WSD64752.1 hypothetical protein OIE69_40595 [Actinacidiphila glaucinigra]